MCLLGGVLMLPELPSLLAGRARAQRPGGPSGLAVVEMCGIICVEAGYRFAPHWIWTDPSGVFGLSRTLNVRTRLEAES
jgi:hypothetical protein